MAVQIREPGCLAQKFHQLGTWLQKPTQAFFKNTINEKLLTTKEIWGLYYKNENLAVSPALQSRVHEIQSQMQWNLALKVLWAVSVVLPILYYVGSLCKKLASLDVAMLQLQSIKNSDQTLQLKALRESMKEFIEMLEIVGCKKEKDDPTTPMELFGACDIRAIAMRKFLESFKNDEHAIEAMTLMCNNILENFSQVFGKDGNKRTCEPATLRLNRESDEDLLNDMAYLIRNFDNVLKQHRGGDMQSICRFAFRPLTGDESDHDMIWFYMTTRKDRFLAICDKRLSN